MSKSASVGPVPGTHCRIKSIILSRGYCPFSCAAIIAST